jgi:hypothetical protein
LNGFFQEVLESIFTVKATDFSVEAAWGWPYVAVKRRGCAWTF